MALPKRTNHMGREGVQTQAWTGTHPHLSTGCRDADGIVQKIGEGNLQTWPVAAELDWQPPRGMPVATRPELADKGEWKARRRRRWASRLWRLGRPAQHRDELCHRRGMGGYTVLQMPGASL